MKEPKPTSSKRLFDNPYISIIENRYDHEGRPLRYFVKDEPDTAVVGMVTREGDIVMVRQFRPGPGRIVYDVPGGMVEGGDTPAEAVAKEMIEETGYTGDLRQVGRAYQSAYSTCVKTIFLATGCIRVAEPHEEPNMIAEPVVLSVEEFKKVLDSGEIVDLDCALLLARHLDLL